MEYISSQTFTSQLSEFSGVSYTLKKFSHGSRSRLRAALAPALDAIRKHTDHIAEISDRHRLDLLGEDAAPMREDDSIQLVLIDNGQTAAPENTVSLEQRLAIDHIGDITREITNITDKDIDIQYLIASFLKMEGIKITDENGTQYGSPDKKPITAKVLFESGPEDLCKEVVANIKMLAGLTDSVKENLELRSISGAPVDSQTLSTIAPDANGNADSNTATAINTSQNG